MLSRLGSIGLPGTENFKKTICLICGLVCAFVPHISPATADTPDGSTATDSSFLAQTIYDQLAADILVSASGLRVSTRGGEIILRGSVPNLRASLVAERNIRNMIGVCKVVNLLQVVLDSLHRSASGLELQVDSALSVNPYVPLSGVSVSVTEGKVVLAGVVTSAFEREQAERAAQSVAGVTGVGNLIMVKESCLGSSSTGPRLVSNDPVVQAMIDSIYLAQGIDPDLAISLKAKMVEYWKDYLNIDSVTARRKAIRGNPATGYYEHFDLLELGKFLIKKIIEKTKDKKSSDRLKAWLEPSRPWSISIFTRGSRSTLPR